MATVVSITNPITGAVEQVDKLDHTAQQIDDAVALAPQLSNPNLLDNWYFGNPVNQRGQTSWTNPSNWQYAIDRWQITPSSVVTLTNDGITVTADLQQGLEKGRLEFGRTYTFSVLSSDGRLGKHTFVLTSDPNINVSFGFGYFVCYLSGGNVWFRIYGDGSTYKAAKLELGSQQTLAHKDTSGNWVLNEIPDYGEQLARCQRYLFTPTTQIDSIYSLAIGVGTSTTTITFFLPLPTTMRAKSSVTFSGLHAVNEVNSVLDITNVANYGQVGNGVWLHATVASGAEVGKAYYLRTSNPWSLVLDANL